MSIASMSLAERSADLRAACAILRQLTSHDIESWAAAGTKASFFEHVRRATAHHNLTGVAREQPTIELHDPARVLVIGDSISREVAGGLAVILPRGNVTYSLVNTPARLGGGGSAWHKAVLAGADRSVRHLEACNFDVLFLGGYGPWALRRLERHPMLPELARSPSKEHETRMMVDLQVMQCVAEKTETPLVFIGSMPLDARTILLDPPKNDWHKFLDFSLAAVRNDAEAGLFARGVLGEAPNVHRLPLEELVASCPSVRCDGMHFKSDYASFHCHHTFAVWYDFLANFLTRGGLVEQTRGPSSVTPTEDTGGGAGSSSGRSERASWRRTNNRPTRAYPGLRPSFGSSSSTRGPHAAAQASWCRLGRPPDLAPNETVFTRCRDEVLERRVYSTPPHTRQG